MTITDIDKVEVGTDHAAIVVRPATVADWLALHHLIPSRVPGVRWPGLSGTTTLVCVRRGVVLGAVDVSVSDGIGEGGARRPDAFVSALYVRPECRGRGLARLLLRGACANVVARGVAWAVAAVDPADVVAQRVLMSAGWQPADGPPGTVTYRRRVLTRTFAR